MTTQSQMEAPRDKWLAVKRGYQGKCPHCGEGKMFRAFLKVAEACPSCGEELHHQRADDAPPYMTIFVVGHIIGAGMLWVEHQNDQLPIWIHATVWPILTLVLRLYFLPRIKGALIGLQWALRLHGFGAQAASAHANLPAPAASPT